MRHSAIYDLVSEIIYGDSNIDFISSYKELKIIDKEYFHKVILENKIASIFLKYINNKDFSDLISKSFYEKCKIQEKRYQIHSLQVINEMRQINRHFANEGLTYIYLKGIALQREYQDISLRPMVDIDMLFKSEDLLRAYEILHKNNFISSDQKQFLDINSINDFCRHFHHIHVVTNNNISIELHHRVTRTEDFINCPISESFFDDFKSIDHFHEKINIPSIENIIIHALCHFSINSSFTKLLRTLIDIKNISLNHEIRWEDIILRYDDVKIRKGICTSLELIDFNQGNIQNLDKARTKLKEYFPKEGLVREAQQKLYDINSLNPAENFLNRFKNFKYLKTIPGVLFPSKSILQYKYKIPNPDISTYIKYYDEQLPKLLLLFQNTRKNKNYFEHNNDLTNWLNKNI